MIRETGLITLVGPEYKRSSALRALMLGFFWSYLLLFSRYFCLQLVAYCNVAYWILVYPLLAYQGLL